MQLKEKHINNSKVFAHFCDVFRTVFGKEYEISVHTTKDDHKFEEKPNHWSFVMNEPGDTHNPGPIFFVLNEHK